MSPISISYLFAGFIAPLLRSIYFPRWKPANSLFINNLLVFSVFFIAFIPNGSIIVQQLNNIDCLIFILAASCMYEKFEKIYRPLFAKIKYCDAYNIHEPKPSEFETIINNSKRGKQKADKFGTTDLCHFFINFSIFFKCLLRIYDY